MISEEDIKLDQIWETIITGNHAPNENSLAGRILYAFHKAICRKDNPEPDSKETLARIIADIPLDQQAAALYEYGMSALRAAERKAEQQEQRRQDEEDRLRREADAPRRAREAEERRKEAEAEEQRKREEYEKAQAARAVREREAAVAEEVARRSIADEAARRIAGTTSAERIAEAREKLRPVPCQAFLSVEEAAPSWLVEGIAVAGQPLLIGGPKKTLKTSIAVDLAISLATGAPFLGCYPVPRPRSVAVFSGESGQAALRSAALRIAEAKGVSIADAPLSWQTTLPNLSSRLDVEALRAECEPFDVVIIDPLYRALGDDTNPANLFSVGSTLGTLGDAFRGKTLVLLHHTVKDTWERKALDLNDLAFAGVQEWARQWLLVNRRRRFDPGQPTDLHNLIVTVGGSAGHAGSFALDIDEGKLTTGFVGRQWLVRVQTTDEAREADKAVRTAKANRTRGPVALVEALIAVLPSDGSRISYTAARKATRRNPTDFAAIVTAAGPLVVEERDGSRRFIRLVEPRPQSEGSRPALPPRSK